jgi:glycosyltransferase involved in cell wall biosynthesis
MNDLQAPQQDPSHIPPESLESLSQRLAASEKELVALQDALLKSQEELRRTKRQLEEVHSSTSWRMTAAFRGPLIRLINLKRTWGVLAFDVASRGGWYAMLAEIGRDIRAYRWQYFKQIGRYLGSNGEFNPAPGSGEHDRNDYRAWRAAGKAKSHPQKTPPADARRPLISVLIPTYKPPLDLLRQAIASVTDQPYDHWEICIADDASHDPALEAYLRQLAADNDRIHVSFRPTNGHISACTNTALTLAKGDYLLLLDQDDLLNPEALLRVADCIMAHPDAAIIYSDEDRINEDASQHTSAYFKPDFNYDLFLGQNMVSHLGVFQRQLIVDIGGFREGLEGSQDYDLALRAMERVQRHQILHIPQVLYHWRAIKGSTALDHSEKSYASTAGRQAIHDHLQRTGQQGEALPAPDLPFFNRVRYELPEAGGLVSVLVALDEPLDKMRDMLFQLWRTRGAIECEFIVCTATPYAAADLLTAFDAAHAPAIRIIRTDVQTALPERLNAAAEQANGYFCCLVSVLFSSTSEGWLEELARVAGQARVAFVAPRIHNRPGLFDHGGVLFTDDMRAVYAHKGQPRTTHGYAGRAALQQEFQALSPALLVVRRALLVETGGFGRDFSGGLALIDKCLELQRQGLANVWMPYADLMFTDAVYSGRTNILTELGLFSPARRRWTAKWSEVHHDRFYNPNLSRQGDFSLNWQA